MEPFTSHTGVGVPLRRSNVDTDQIIPAVYLKRVSRTGFEDGLFSAWRNDPEFVLNRPEYAAGTVLVAGPDFGTGSSREHAVWALMDYGFEAVIAPSFGDIFRNNSSKQGLVTVQLSVKDVEDLNQMVKDDPSRLLVVDVEPELHKPFLYRGIGKRFDRRGIELGDDVLRRPLRRPEAEPARHIEPGDTCLIGGRNVRHRGRTLRREVGKRLDLAGPDLRQRHRPLHHQQIDRA